MFSAMSEDSSDGGCTSDAWIPYSKREEWKDIAPVSQDDGANPVVQIAYSDKCKFVMPLSMSLLCLVFVDILPTLVVMYFLSSAI